MRGDEHGFTSGLEFADELGDRRRPDGIHARGRLVENHQLRIMHERLREADALQHTLRIRSHASIRRLGEPDPSNHFDDARREGRTVQTADAAVKRDEFAAAQEPIKVGRLRQVTDGQPRLDALARHAKHPTRARRGTQQTQNNFDRRALAGAIGPEQTKNFPRRDREAEIVHRAQSHTAQAQGEILGQPAQFNRR